MGRRKRTTSKFEGLLAFLSQLAVERPLLLLSVLLILFLWAIEKWILHLTSWVPLLLAVWAAIQYANYERRIVVDDLNKKWKRIILESSPTTAIEHCEWFNKLLMEIWSNYFNPMLSTRFSSIVESRLKHRRPRFLEKVELQEFSLGSSPPNVALQGVRWSTLNSQVGVFHNVLKAIYDCGIKISISEALKYGSSKVPTVSDLLAKPFYGTARIVVNHLFVKGDLQLIPILDGRAILYSFLSVPEVRIDVAFGGGTSQSLPSTVLPGVSSWLVKLLTDTLVKTMVEPRRRCFSLPAVHLRKHAVGGIIHVTVLGANQIFRNSLKGSPSRKQHGYDAVNSSPDEHSNKDIQTFVEVEIEDLTRRTKVETGSTPNWNSTFNMVMHDNAGTLKFHLYDCPPGSVKYDFLASCEVKLRYSEDDSTIFWAVGSDSSVIARHAEICGKEVEMSVPFEGANGFNSGELMVKLVLKEWQFSDGSHSFHLNSHQNLDGSTNFSEKTGRKLSVTVVEAKDLTTKDRSGKCSPYVKLHYGKAMKKTRSVQDNSTCPNWEQKFEFDELSGGEYLTLKCMSEETFGDEHIGSARVNLDGLVDGAIKDVWIPLEKVKSGELRLQIEAVRVNNQLGSKDSMGGSGSGLIELVLVEARDLIAADLRGTSDPYVKVQYGELKRRTKVIYKTLTPKWNQTLEFPDDGSPLTLYVRDYNTILHSSSIGQCVVEYQMLPYNQTYDKWIPLQGVKKGEIHIRITRRDLELDRRSSIDSDPFSAKAHKITDQMKQLLIRLQSIAAEDDDSSLEGILETVSELESLEDMQEEYMLQLETERGLLLNKITELSEELMNSSSPSVSRTSSTAGLTHHSKSLS